MLGELLTKWTIRLALACYVAAVAGWLASAQRGQRRESWLSAIRWLWTLGCGLLIAHIACAFHFYHDWSHAAAYESTAAETDSVLGVRFGEGIYFNYAFTLLWLADVVWMWVRPASVIIQWSWPRLFFHAYLFLIAFNGAIVFEAGPTRWAGIAACLAFAGLAGRAAYNGRRSERGNGSAGASPSRSLTSDL